MIQSEGSVDVFNSTDPEVTYSLVQNIFSTTKCYDIMQNSSKVMNDAAKLTVYCVCLVLFFVMMMADTILLSLQATVFETTIPFQLAFFALVEHGESIR